MSNWMDGKTLTEIADGVGRPGSTAFVPNPDEPALVQSARKVVAESSYQWINAVGGALADAERAEQADAAVPEMSEAGEILGIEPDVPAGTIMLDLFTAGMICQVWDSLNAENRASFARLSAKSAVLTFVDHLWKVVNGAKGRA